MDIPETFKEIDINGRKFILNKFDARTGSYMTFKLMKILTPIFKNINVDNSEEKVNLGDLNFEEIANSLFGLEEKEFRYIQDHCLQSVNELLPAGPQKILNEYGVWGIKNLEFDASLVMNLTIQSLVYNIQGFFKEGPLASLAKGLNISRPNLKM